jgi:hypothetical protein
LAARKFRTSNDRVAANAAREAMRSSFQPERQQLFLLSNTSRPTGRHWPSDPYLFESINLEAHGADSHPRDSGALIRGAIPLQHPRAGPSSRRGTPSEKVTPTPNCRGSPPTTHLPRAIDLDLRLNGTKSNSQVRRGGVVTRVSASSQGLR